MNARCSVIAAANPVYGEYQPDMSASKNISLPDSLLSRFDLLFIVLDQKKPEMDKYVSERVVRNHQYISKSQKEQGFFNNEDDFVLEAEYNNQLKDNQVFEKTTNSADQKIVT